ncbi:hypothetical protein LX36DRAFT_183365 [Colletotrichum falcatum]|nr:hypothetical protein LX36DRAFT_183365 [Colletotrichum falcatum]
MNPAPVWPCRRLSDDELGQPGGGMSTSHVMLRISPVPFRISSPHEGTVLNVSKASKYKSAPRKSQQENMSSRRMEEQSPPAPLVKRSRARTGPPAKPNQRPNHRAVSRVVQSSPPTPPPPPAPGPRDRDGRRRRQGASWSWCFFCSCCSKVNQVRPRGGGARIRTLSSRCVKKQRCTNKHKKPISLHLSIHPAPLYLQQRPTCGGRLSRTVGTRSELSVPLGEPPPPPPPTTTTKTIFLKHRGALQASFGVASLSNRTRDTKSLRPRRY